MPTGSIQWFAGNTVPAGWLKCDGSSYSTTAKAALFSAIGIMYGGSGGNFNVPDLRGEFIRGWDDSRGIDSGRGMGSNQGEAIQSHAHSVFHASGGSGNNMAFGSGYGVGYSTGAAGGPETRPRNVALMAIIKE